MANKITAIGLPVSIISVELPGWVSKRCVECGQEVLQFELHDLSVETLCIACAAARGNPQVAELYRAIYGPTSDAEFGDRAKLSLRGPRCPHLNRVWMPLLLLRSADDPQRLKKTRWLIPVGLCEDCTARVMPEDFQGYIGTAFGESVRFQLAWIRKETAAEMFLPKVENSASVHSLGKG